ncbi:MAG: MarR family winged helix-turn-helix transcriptional regulator [Methanobrevibacter sp.]|jgi:DNA-binding MarR family transcriptional regulator|nr:MarR family winged helix-turn-helix transcriptional regulator [Candidatus Methanoflexus mossambicus]
MNKIKFDDENSICWLFPKIMVLLRKKIQKRLNSVGLLWDQWIVLSQVYRFEGTNQKNISNTSLKNEASLTRTINFLENNNLVKRENSKKDKREFLIYTTDHGKKIFEESEEIMDEIQMEINEIFHPNDLKAMQSLLMELFENLE